MTRTKVLKVNPRSPEKDIIEFAARLIEDGRLVAFPTETVYGIGANFLDKAVIKRLYDVKGRPETKPFTIHIADLGMIKRMKCEIPILAEKLIRTFWPGPLTIILKSENGKLGFRMPRNIIAKALIAKSGVPVAAPSANTSGKSPAVNANEVLNDIGEKVDLILDGGETEVGKESTVVDIVGLSYKIVRKGAISEDKIAEVLKEF